MDAETWPYVNEGGLGRGYHLYQLKKHKKLVYKMGPLLLGSFRFMVKKFSKVKEQTSFPNGDLAPPSRSGLSPSQSGPIFW